jgi:hypothetical protein
VSAGDRLVEELLRLQPEGMSANRWAVEAGLGRTVWADLRRHGNPSRRTLEKLLVAAGSSLAEFEALRADGIGEVVDANSGVGDFRPSWRSGREPGLPLHASTAAGDYMPSSGIGLIRIDRAHVTERIERPKSLAGAVNAFAFVMIGTMMWPRFRPGRRLAVVPDAAVAIGDDVLVSLGDDSLSTCIVAEVVRNTAAKIELRQYNPDVLFAVPLDRVGAVHRIAGELI